MGGGGTIRPTGRRPELDSLPVRSFIIMEAKIMKMAKKFLAVALAGVLALSVLTGCGASVKSKDIADALTKMGVKVEQDKDMDKTAEETLAVIEAMVNAPDNAAKADTDPDKITLDNAVNNTTGKIISNGTTRSPDAVIAKILGLYQSSDGTSQKENIDKNVKVALVKIENATKDASLQAALVKDGLATVCNRTPSDNQKFDYPGKLGSAKTSDGKYILVVIVTGLVAKNA